MRTVGRTIAVSAYSGHIGGFIAHNAWADWMPPVPASERMRGLEAQEVWTAEQLKTMRDIKAGYICFLPRHNNAQSNKNMSTHNSRLKASRTDIGSQHCNISTDVAILPDHTVPYVPMGLGDDKRPVVREWISITRHLDDNDMKLLLAEAQRRAAPGIFVEDLLDSEHPPIRYESSPRNLRLTDFIKTEWLDKGHNPNDIDRRLLAAYDGKLVRAIENYEYANGPLPDELRFPKVGNRKSKKELTQAMVEHTPK